MLNETAELFDFATVRGRADRALDQAAPTDLVAGLISGTVAKPASVATALLQRFRSLLHVGSASVAELLTVDGMTAEAANRLRIAHEIAVRQTREQIPERSVISSWQALLDYARVAMAGASVEQFRVLFLDRKNGLIADEVMGTGTVDHAPVYPREVMRRALELSASAVILAHNHPSGDPTPSSVDVTITRTLIDAGRIFGVAIHDHIVVGSSGIASLKALGLI